MRKTKIVCTIGPSSSNSEILEKLLVNGMDVARINSSHSSTDDVLEKIIAIRELAKKNNVHTAIMLDLQGPKIRIGKLEKDIFLIDNQDIIFKVQQNMTISVFPLADSYAKDRKDEKHSVEYTTSILPLIVVEYEGFLNDIYEGSRIFIDDGLIEVLIKKVDKINSTAEAMVIKGGILKSRKGINLPGIKVSASSVTDKDLDFLKFGIENEVDFIAQSFVRSSEDVKLIKDIIKENKSHIMVISKIEKQEAVEDFENILQISDAIMIARGDLGIEIPEEDVPSIQKEIIRKANIVGKPVITATQMLDSMIRNPRPTRAEVSDVANAILDGSDALMLSGETASGNYPLETLNMMVRIISRTEKSLDYHEIIQKKFIQKQRSITEAISFAACEMAHVLNAAAIITATQSGSTARQVSKNRPSSIIIGASPYEHVVRQLMLSWGVIPVKTGFTENIDAMLHEVVKASKLNQYINKDDSVVITGGILSNKPGSTNFINIQEVE